MRHTDYYKRIFSTLVAIVVAIVTSSAQSLVYVETDHEGTYEKKMTGDRLPDYNFSINEYGLYTYYFYIKNTSGQAGTVKPTSIEYLNEYAQTHLNAAFCYNGTCYSTIEQCPPFEIDAYGEFRGGTNFDGSLITEGSGLDMQIMYKGRPEPGTAEIKLSFQFEHDTNPSICYLSLNFTPIDISLDKEEMTLEIGEEESLVARINGIPNNTDIDWKSDNPDIATVNVDGIVKAISQGTTTIYATAKGSMYFATCKVTVKSDKATDIVLDKNELTLNIGDKERLTATVLPESAKDKSVRWYSSAQRIATVNADGVVTAISVGTAVITVTTNDGGFTASCQVHVTIPVEQVILAEDTVTTSPYGTLTLEYTVLPEEATNQHVLFRSANEGIVMCYGSTLMGVAVGTTQVIAVSEDGHASDTCVVNVIIPIEDITLNESSITLSNATPSFQLRATLYPEDATEVPLVWTSGDESVATVNSNGLVSGHAKGSTTVTVSTPDREHSASCYVIVSENVANEGADASFVSGRSDKGDFLIESSCDIRQASVFNMAGSKVYEDLGVASGTLRIPAQHLADGLYLILVELDNGQTASLKIAK